MPSSRHRPRLERPFAATHSPPPEPSGDIGVLSVMQLGNRTQWLRVGIAHVEPGLGGSKILCIQLGAIPTDRMLYVPLGDVLACCGVEPAGPPEMGHA